jgi:hypothetical protein
MARNRTAGSILGTHPYGEFDTLADGVERCERYVLVYWEIKHTVDEILGFVGVAPGGGSERVCSGGRGVWGVWVRAGGGTAGIGLHNAELGGATVCIHAEFLKHPEYLVRVLLQGEGRREGRR